VKRSIPPVFSSTPTSTLTPHTITRTGHGTVLTTGPSRAAPVSTSRLAAPKAESPGWALKRTTPAIHAAVTKSVSQCTLESGPLVAFLTSTRPASLNASPPSNSQAAALTRAWAAKLAAHTDHSWPPRPASRIRCCTSTPTALVGDRLPAFAPFPTINAVRNTGSPTLAAIAMAGGATSAVAEIAPGPIVETVQASRKKSGGRSMARPRHNRTARLVSASIVPFACETPKSSDTPSRVRKSDEGKVCISASAFHPAA
jgi:hypothetical protein